jgi:hypothetical protein
MGHSNPDLMKPGEAARVFGVDPKTLARWALDAEKTNRLSGRETRLFKATRWTPGGHRRYVREAIHEIAESPEAVNATQEREAGC